MRITEPLFKIYISKNEFFSYRKLTSTVETFKG